MFILGRVLSFLRSVNVLQCKLVHTGVAYRKELLPLCIVLIITPLALPLVLFTVPAHCLWCERVNVH